MMKPSLRIPLISGTGFSKTIPSNAASVTLDVANWPQTPVYKPEVNVYLWHDDKTLFISYKVKEDYIRAVVCQDNGHVCKDSCVEFFIAFDKEGYYNIEANCIGKVLMSHRKERKVNVVYSTENQLSKIKRISSLGYGPIPGHKTDEAWQLTLEIPVESFFKHNFKSFRGLNAKCNIYKCGDDLPVPHFLSWKKIETEKPDFHRPEYFSEIEFE